MNKTSAFSADDCRVVLITRTITNNQGNQALSVVWRDFLTRRYPEAEVRLIERAPSYLKRYTFAEVARQRDPVAAFDAIAASLVAQLPPSSITDPSVWNVQLTLNQQHVTRFLKLRKALRLRGRVASLGVGKAAYLNRLAFICRSPLVVVNPAGEFMPGTTDTALYYLLETRCAQIAGASTAFVNLSFEIADPVLARLSDHVFRHCDLTEFRDDESLKHLRATGGTAEPLILPDGAAASRIERPETSGGGGLGLALNALQLNAHGLTDKWSSLVARLLQDRPVTLTSNEWGTDSPFWNPYLERPGIVFDGMGLPYDQYAQLLSRFDVVVSSRLHTCVLAMLAGTAVVPIEISTFKLSGFFNMIGLGNDPVRMDREGWQDEVVARIDAAMADRAGRIARQDQAITAARQAFDTRLSEAFRDEWLAPAVQ